MNTAAQSIVVQLAEPSLLHLHHGKRIWASNMTLQLQLTIANSGRFPQHTELNIEHTGDWDASCVTLDSLPLTMHPVAAGGATSVYQHATLA